MLPNKDGPTEKRLLYVMANRIPLILKDINNRFSRIHPKTNNKIFRPIKDWGRDFDKEHEAINHLLEKYTYSKEGQNLVPISVKNYTIDESIEYIVQFTLDLYKASNVETIVDQNTFKYDKIKLKKLTDLQLMFLGYFSSTINNINFSNIEKLQTNIDKIGPLQKIRDSHSQADQPIFFEINKTLLEGKKLLAGEVKDYKKNMFDYHDCILEEIYHECKNGDKLIMPCFEKLFDLNKNDKYNKSKINSLRHYKQTNTNNTILHAFCMSKNLNIINMTIILPYLIPHQVALKEHLKHSHIYNMSESIRWGYFYDTNFNLKNNENNDCLDLICKNDATTLKSFEYFYNFIVPFDELFEFARSRRNVPTFTDTGNVLCEQAIAKPHKINVIMQILAYLGPIETKKCIEGHSYIGDVLNEQLENYEKYNGKNLLIIFCLMDHLSKNQYVNIDLKMDFNEVEMICERPFKNQDDKEKFLLFIMIALVHFDKIKIDELADKKVYFEEKNLPHLAEFCSQLKQNKELNLAWLDLEKETNLQTSLAISALNTLVHPEEKKLKAKNFLLSLKAGKKFFFPEPPKPVRNMILVEYLGLSLPLWVLYFTNTPPKELWDRFEKTGMKPNLPQNK